MPKEWFAEAFHDVYTKGAGAKPTSIEIVKEYERRQTAKQKSRFQKKSRGWLTRAARWFSRKFNFGRRHGEPEAPQINAVPDVPQPNIPALPQVPVAGPAAMNAVPELQLPAAGEPQLIEDENLDPDMVVERPKKKLKKKKKK